MENKNEYRIAEYCGIFTIEVKVYKTKGFLWWKKRTSSWHYSNTRGGALRPKSKLYPKCQVFRTLDEARGRIRMFKKSISYHSP